MGADESKKKSKKTVSADVDNVNNNNSTTVLSNNDIDLSKYIEIDNKVEAFVKADTNGYSSFQEWNDFFKEYERILLIIADYESSSDSSENRLDTISFTARVNFKYDASMNSFAMWQAKHLKELEDKSDKQQITTLSVFSIFMTLLTFLLANISKVISGKIDLKGIVLTNLTLLCVASTVFLFIGVFLGLVGKGDSRKVRGIKYAILAAFPFVFLLAILLVMFIAE